MSIGVLLAVGATVFALDTWGSDLKYRFIAKRWGVVVPGQIYRSGQVSKWMLEKQIREHQIGEVIDMNGIEPTDRHQAHEIELMKRLGLPHHRFAMRGDGTGDIARHADAIETLVRCQKQGVPVLVHCSAGAQRTGGVVAMYRVLVQGWSTDEALDEMESYGWKPTRDLELVPFLNENIQSLAEMLVQRGVIEKVPEPLPVYRR